MPIKPRNAAKLPANFEKSLKLDVPGDYICTVVDTRFNPENDRFNESYYIDFKVVEGPAYIGREAHVCKYPQDAKGGKNKKTGKVFSSKQAREKDEIRVQQWLVACYGLTWDQAGEFAEGGVDDDGNEIEPGSLAGEFDKCFTGEDPETRVKGSSPVAGNKILVRVKAYGKDDDGKEKCFSDIYPFIEGESKASAAPAAKAAAPTGTAKKAPPPPPKAKAKPSFEDAAAAAGYQPYEGMENEYMVLYQNGEPVETFEIADVKAKLGY